MKAVYITEFGGVENLEIRDVSPPADPRGTEVIVNVKAAALNRADLLQRRGRYPAPEGFSQQIPGLEFAGEVAAIGEAVSEFVAGDRVMAITSGGAQAEFVSVDARQLMRIPANLGFAEAAAVPEAFITAHDAIYSQAGLEPGETLLIHAVGSGIGLAALQLGKVGGSRVFGTSRTAEKLERCREFGLDLGIVVDGVPLFADRLMQHTDGHGVDVIFDLVGAGYFKENLAAAALKARWMLVGLTSGSKTEFDLSIALSKRLKLIGTVLRPRTAEEKADATKSFAEYGLPLLASGQLRPNVDKVFAAREIRKAHEYLESNESFGKVVLEF